VTSRQQQHSALAVLAIVQKESASTAVETDTNITRTSETDSPKMLDLTIVASKTRAAIESSLDKFPGTTTAEMTTIEEVTGRNGKKTATEVEATITPRTVREDVTMTLTSTTGTSEMPATKTNLN